VEQRKQAIKDFKARQVPRGIFAVRCAPTGRVWIDSSPNLDAARNSLWFFLRNGYHPDKALQAEWNANGVQAFQYEILEKLNDDVSPLAVKDLLKEKKLHWAGKLGAAMLSPA